jgi:DNA primase
MNREGLSLIGQYTDIKKVSSVSGGEYAGPCPACGGDDRFRLWPAHPVGKLRWWCRGCERSGDDVDFLRLVGEDAAASNLLRDRLGDSVMRREYIAEGTRYALADAALGRDRRGYAPGSGRYKPPSLQWQRRAGEFLRYARDQLWNGPDPWPLDYLRGRGLSDALIEAAELGYNPKPMHDKPERWGLEPADGKKGVWLGQGIVIPWEIDEELWRLNVRLRFPIKDRKTGKQTKYLGPRGLANGLYGADTLGISRPAILVEGEIDALTIAQYAGDLVSVAATGSTHGARLARWVACLSLPPLVLVAFDNDPETAAGDAAAAWWLDTLANARRWRPYWRDVNQMARDGASVRGWVEAGLSQATELSPAARQPNNKPFAPIPEMKPQPFVPLAEVMGIEGNEHYTTFTFPPEAGLATIGGQWQRDPDGRIEAAYTLDELKFCHRVMDHVRGG